MVVLIERKILQRNAIVLYPRCALSICVAEFIVFVLALSREADCEILREKDTTEQFNVHFLFVSYFQECVFGFSVLEQKALHQFTNQQ
jgi:hypothetical protein